MNAEKRASASVVPDSSSEVRMAVAGVAAFRGFDFAHAATAATLSTGGCPGAESFCRSLMAPIAESVSQSVNDSPAPRFPVVASAMIFSLFFIGFVYLWAAEVFTHFLYPGPGVADGFFVAASLNPVVFDLLIL